MTCCSSETCFWWLFVRLYFGDFKFAKLICFADAATSEQRRSTIQTSELPGSVSQRVHARTPDPSSSHRITSVSRTATRNDASAEACVSTMSKSEVQKAIERNSSQSPARRESENGRLISFFRELSERAERREKAGRRRHHGPHNREPVSSAFILDVLAFSIKIYILINFSEDIPENCFLSMCHLTISWIFSNFRVLNRILFLLWWM